MRPPKSIYLHCRDEMRRSVLQCVLETWNFRVATRPHAATVSDVALIVNDGNAPGLVNRLDRECPELRIVVLLKRKDLRKFNDRTGALMLDDTLPMIELRDYMRTAAIRKPGPKPIRTAKQEAMSA